MTIAIDYALMAGASYMDTRDPINRFPIPQGWTDLLKHEVNKTSGFEATAYSNGNEIVISFAGTDPADIGGDIAADFDLAAGFLTAQLKQAADYYLKIKNDPANAGKTITLTGHSLGGGLASLIAVMFGESASTFDQAPFRNAARTYTTTDPNTGFITTRSAAQDLRDYLAGKATVNGVLDPQIANLLAPLDAYIVAADPFQTNPNLADTLAAREAKVTSLSVQGELLSALSSLRIGTALPSLTHGDYFAPINLHSQALLSAFLQSNKTAATDKALNNVTVNLPDLLKMIFDDKLYYRDPNNKENPQRNFLENIVRHEAGGGDSSTVDGGLDNAANDAERRIAA